ncbi:MAG: metallophosphoesterase [Chitinophagaceae bacterium]
MSKRREFLKISSLATGAMLLTKPLESVAGFSRRSGFLNRALNEIEIFHSNDLHSKLTSNTDGLGGLDNINLLLNKQSKSIVLDAGDFLDENATLSEHIETIKAMNTAGYHAGTPGNHELAKGQEYLAALLPHMHFPLVNCNYLFSNEQLKQQVKPFTIVKFGRFKIGITGVGVQLDKNLRKKEKIICAHPYPKANAVAKMLKEQENCDLVICLSHLGQSSIKGLPQNKEFALSSAHIDLIIGGHGRSITAGPSIYHNEDGHEVIVSQTGWNGLIMRKLSIGYNYEGSRFSMNCRDYITGLHANDNFDEAFKSLTA